MLGAGAVDPSRKWAVGPAERFRSVEVAVIGGSSLELTVIESDYPPAK
jgi:hypothetical protein